MATAQQCEQAFHTLAERLASADPATRRSTLDRSLTATLTDIGVVFAAHLKDGELLDIRQVSKADGQVKLRLTSDDLLRLVDGELKFGSAWSSGRIKIDASVLDLIKLRSVF